MDGIPVNSRQGDREDVIDDSPNSQDNKDPNQPNESESKQGKLTSNDPQEVRSMLEYLYLDVKVRSPAEVSA